MFKYKCIIECELIWIISCINLELQSSDLSHTLSINLYKLCVMN
jgi:hypothetical protein